jgi:DNA-nicking Smr family endonuclease
MLPFQLIAVRTMSDKKITDKDRNLFREAMSDVRQLAHKPRVQKSKRRPPPHPLQRHRDEQQVLVDMLSEPLDPSDLETGDELLFSRIGLQHKTLRRLRRGEYSIEAELDLHGHTKLEARQAVVEFLHRCQQQGCRIVRIIHGKGLGSHQKRGVLKQYVNHWLRQRDEVLAFCSALPCHGGTGALYVMLKRQ